MPTDDAVEESNLYSQARAIDTNARYFRNWQSMDNQYDPWKALYKELADYVAPGRGRFIDQEGQANQKTKASSKLINPVAADALHMMGAGLHGGLSSPARPWFQLGFHAPDLDKFSAGRAWLDDCEKRLYAVLRRSNFYSVVHNVYEEVGGFGTGCLFVDSHPEYIVNFSYLTAGDYRFAVDERARTHCLYRKIRMQIHQMAKLFGKEKLSDTCKNLLSTNPYEWRTVLHCIEPREDYVNGSEFASQMPWRSIYLEWQNNKDVLLESGYMEMPMVTPRWQALTHEAYGWGPGPEALGISKMIQRMELNAQLAEDKFLDPPMGVPSGFKDRMLDLSPGAKNVYDKGKEGSKAFERLIDIDPNSIRLYEERIGKLETKVRRLMFNDLFLMIANADQSMTATEVNARQEEKMIMLGPAINRLLYEMLDPVIERVFALCGRAGLLKPPPPDVAESEYKVEYISILAQAQKLVNAQSIQAYVQMAGAAAQLNPSSVDKTDMDKLMEVYGDIINLPSGIVREDDQVDQIRQVKADEAARQQALMDAQNQAGVVKTLGDAQSGEDTALGQLEQSMGAA